MPAYLRKRQEEMAEEKRHAARPMSPQPPPGYRKVGEEERQSALEALRKRRAEVEKAQQALPFKIETVGQRQREKDLNDRLAHAGRLLEMFGKPLVFVPVDSDPLAAAPPLLGGGADGPGPGPGPSRATVADASPGAAMRGRSGSASPAEALTQGGSGGSVGPPRPRLGSRESRAAANSERRRQAGVAVPWDELVGRPPGAMAASAVRTEVKVAAPPGGVSSLQLG